MGRPKKGTKENPATLEDLENAIDILIPAKPFIITKADIKDLYCGYTYKINAGVGQGDKVTVDGNGIVDDDMVNAFAKLNVHLAYIDDVYKHSGIEIDDIDKFHTDNLALLYYVTGFEIKGSEDQEKIILTGSKYINCGGRIKIVTPEIILDNSSSYQWYNELKTASDNARYEVESYKNGKYTTPKQKEPKLKQAKFPFGDGKSAAAGENIGSDEDEFDAELENAKL